MQLKQEEREDHPKHKEQNTKAEIEKRPVSGRTKRKCEYGARCWESWLGPLVLYSKELPKMKLPTLGHTILEYPPVTF